MEIDDVIEIYDIPFWVSQSKRSSGKMAGKRNVTVVAALSCSVLIHLCAGYFFLHMPQEPPVKRPRPMEVTTIILSQPIKPASTLVPRVAKAARQSPASPRVTRAPEPLPAKPAQTAPVLSRVAAAPELKNISEKTARPLPASTAAAPREPAPSAAQAPGQPVLQHAQAYAAAAGSRGEVSAPKDAGSPKDAGASQPVIGPSYSAAYLSNPAPKYPAAARRLKLQGTATVRVQVSAEGRPVRVTLQKTSGTRALDEAALEAVQQWSFVPARRGGKPAAAEVDVPLWFTLK